MRWPRGGKGAEAGSRARSGGPCADRFEVDGAGNKGAGGGQEGVEIGVLDGLDEAQVALGERQGGDARDGAEDGHAGILQGGDQHVAVAIGAHAVEDDAGDLDVAAEIAEAAGKCCDRLALAGDVEDQHDGQAQGGGEIGGRTGGAVRAVEQAHDAFHQEEIGRGIGEDAGDGAGPHGPGSRLGQGRPLATSWKRGSM
jgi:hypothetical protein